MQQKQNTVNAEAKEKHDAILQMMKEACQVIPTGDMVVAAIQFLHQRYLRPLLAKPAAPANKIDAIRSAIHELYRNYYERFQKTPTPMDDAAPVVNEYIQFFIQDSTNTTRMDSIRRARDIVKEFIDGSTERGAVVVPSYLWIQYAELIYRDAGIPGDSSCCIPVLQRALQSFPMHQQPDYLNILEQLFCLYIHARTSKRTDEETETTACSDVEILQLLDEIVLLSPTLSSLPPKSLSMDGMSHRPSTPSVVGIVPSIPNLLVALLQYIECVVDQNRSMDPHCKKMNEQLFRKVCDKIILESNLLFQWFSNVRFTQDFPAVVDKDASRIDMELTSSNFRTIVQQLFDIVIEAEVEYLRVVRLYDRAIQFFQKYEPSWAQVYQEQKAEFIRCGNGSVREMNLGKIRSRKRPKITMSTNNSTNCCDGNNTFASIPVLDFSIATSDSEELSQLYWKYQIIHVKGDKAKAVALMPSTNSQTALCWEDIGSLFEQLNEEDQATFCVETKVDGSSKALQAKSFLSSHPSNAKNQAYCSFLLQKSTKLYSDTIQRLPFQGFPNTTWTYEPTVWFFFGRNLIGSTNLDGRPEHTDSVSHDGTWHYQLSGSKRWIIRPTSELLNRVQSPGLATTSEFFIDCHEGDILIINTRLWFHRTVIPPQRLPSVSFARDFRIGDALLQETSPCNMTNVDGLYATEDISKGTVVFTESDMPDCELHRSSIDPNCEVATLEDGTMAVVSIRRIKAGEFFCVPESSDEEYSDTWESESESLLSIE